MKKLITVILLLNAAMTQAQDKENFISLSINGGYSFTQSLPVAGMELGARLHNLYVGVQGLVPVSRMAAAPVVASLDVGYNVGQFNPFLSYGYQTAGGEYKDIFKPEFKFGGGLSYYFSKIPILITGQVQGNKIILTSGINITF